MIAITKQQKIKKQLIHLAKLSSKILDRSLDQTTGIINELTKEKKQLELKKLAFSYDELKKQYNDFTILKHESKISWKLDKPKLAEGAVFTCIFDTYRHYLNSNLPYSSLAIANTPFEYTKRKISRYKPKPFLAKAFYEKSRRSKLANMRQALSIIDITSTNDTETIYLYELMNQKYDAVVLANAEVLSKSNLDKLAKATNTNFII